jgi:hypothetical protein
LPSRQLSFSHFFLHLYFSVLEFGMRISVRSAARLGCVCLRASDGGGAGAQKEDLLYEKEQILP